MIIEELTMPAFIKALTKTRTIIVPFGAVEEHGQHLPLGTDTIAEIRDETIETENDSHAGEVETSLMLHPRPAHINGTSQEEYPSFPTPILARDKKSSGAATYGVILPRPLLKREKLCFRRKLKPCYALINRIESFDG